MLIFYSVDFQNRQICKTSKANSSQMLNTSPSTSTESMDTTSKAALQVSTPNQTKEHVELEHLKH